jgi:hypothetical protein
MRETSEGPIVIAITPLLIVPYYSTVGILHRFCSVGLYRKGEFACREISGIQVRECSFVLQVCSSSQIGDALANLVQLQPVRF